MYFFFRVLAVTMLFCSSASFADDNAKKSSENVSVPDNSGPMLSGVQKIHVTRFTITGNRVFTSEELSQITKPYENRELAIEELEEMRQLLSRYYIDRGYINSGVIIPDQKVVSGVLALHVIEGVLKHVDIEGLQHYSAPFFTKRLLRNGTTPLNIVTLQESLQLLQQDNRIKRINVELTPTSMAGEARLNVKVAENSPYYLALRTNNDGPPSTGAYRGELSAAHRNLFGLGDTLAADFGITEGAKDVAASYTVPLTSHDTTFSMFYSQSGNSVTEETFKPLDIKNDSRTAGLKLRHPFHPDTSSELAFSLSGEWRESASTLLGREFSFSEGEQNGKSKVSVLRFGQEFIRRGTGYLFAVHSTFSYGLEALGSTVNTSTPDSRFLSWLGQMVILGKLGGTSLELMSRTNTQISFDPLLPIEKFGIGGLNSVRGYRRNTLVRDNGVNSSLELRIPLIDDAQGWGKLQFIPFSEVGWGWNTNSSTATGPDYIAGVGGGLTWRLWERVLLEAYYAYPVQKITYSREELADKGFHFQCTVTVF